MTTGPSIDKVLDRMPITLHTVGEVAQLLGRSSSTLRRWRHDELLIPSYVLYQGELRMPLYSDEDLQRAKEVSRNMRRGPKPKSTKVLQ